MYDIIKIKKGEFMRKSDRRYIIGDLSEHEKKELYDDFNFDVYKKGAYILILLDKAEYEVILKLNS